MLRNIPDVSDDLRAGPLRQHYFADHSYIQVWDQYYISNIACSIFYKNISIVFALGSSALLKFVGLKFQRMGRGGRIRTSLAVGLLPEIIQKSMNWFYHVEMVLNGPDVRKTAVGTPPINPKVGTLGFR
jgi:hypothetical protein